MLRSDNIAVARQRRRSCDLVLQLADVAGPIVLSEDFDRHRLKTGDLLAKALSASGQKQRRQRWDIFAANPQRRKMNRKRGQPKVQVFAKAPRRNRRFQVAIVDRLPARPRFAAAYRRAASLRPPARRAAASLASRPTSRRFRRAGSFPRSRLETDRPDAGGSRERPPAMTEQFALEQGLRHHGAVDGTAHRRGGWCDESHGRPVPCRSVLTLNENRNRGSRRALHQRNTRASVR